MTSGMWVIGYGSLMFKPPPHFQFRVNGYIKGYIRRFWQSSSDHRGTPDFPGRVVTLIPYETILSHSQFSGDVCTYELKPKFPEVTEFSSHHFEQLTADDFKVWGCAYYIGPENVDEVKQYLDIREQDGYTAHKVPFHVMDIPSQEYGEDYIMSCIPKTESNELYIESMVYIGTVDNESFVGPELVVKTGARISSSVGPSGSNMEYLVKLCEAVKELDLEGKSPDKYLEDLLGLCR